MKKMECEMEQVFDQKAREKHAKLKESEAELARRHEATRRALEAQARDLEERQRALRAEQAAWERDTGLSLDDLRRRSLEANSKERTGCWCTVNATYVAQSLKVADKALDISYHTVVIITYSPPYNTRSPEPIY
ncbi:unnamed protein product [Danaus chrysippus]|uniref:(African queen) hypothetical protein n=1 Tax=Danaus chrysippus TaxID=151541 RepID=A0A8J2W5Z2_9NEOP|nr:unnamed protein product [Danaus chrysippus]